MMFVTLYGNSAVPSRRRVETNLFFLLLLTDQSVNIVTMSLFRKGEKVISFKRSGVDPRHCSASIDWRVPDPQNGLDRFIGPGATKGEMVLQFAVPTLFAATLCGMAAVLPWGWTPVQVIGATVLAFDTLGGVITNATGAAKRWYHRSGQSRRDHLLFVAVHAVQVALFSWLFTAPGWVSFLIVYGYLLFASAVIVGVPVYLQRPVSLTCLAGGIAVSLYALRVPAQLEWFVPLFYVKIFVSHLLHEEPYRPLSATANAAPAARSGA